MIQISHLHVAVQTITTQRLYDISANLLKNITHPIMLGITLLLTLQYSNHIIYICIGLKIMKKL